MKSCSDTSRPCGLPACMEIIAARVSNRCAPIGPRIFAYSTHSAHCAFVIAARKWSADG